METPVPAPNATPQTGVSSPVRGVVLLRIGLGTIWSINLLYILNPANQFFSTFTATALSFAPQTLGGPGLADAAAAYPALGSGLVAAVTIYLAVGLLLGVTTRPVCIVGIVFNAGLLVTQFGQLWTVPGGTDVGPMPLYLLVYLTLLVAHAERFTSLDAWWAAHRIRAAPSRVLEPANPNRAVVPADVSSQPQS